MTNLVTLNDGEPVTSSMMIASMCGVEHASVMLLIRNKKSRLEALEGSDFKSHPLKPPEAFKKERRQC